MQGRMIRKTKRTKHTQMTTISQVSKKVLKGIILPSSSSSYDFVAVSVMLRFSNPTSPFIKDKIMKINIII